MLKLFAGLAKVAFAVSLLVCSTTACVPGTPLIPPDVHDFVAGDDRMRTYDLAWQEIRALNDHIVRGITDELVTESLVVIARMHRLETGSPSRLSNRANELKLERLLSEAALRDSTANALELEQAARDLETSFDDGDFRTAKEFGFIVLALSTHLYPVP